MVVSTRLAQWVEHQTVNLAVTGSTPVPTPQAENLLPTRPEGGGPMCDRPPAAERPAARGFRADCSWGSARRNRRPRRSRLSAWQHGRVPCSAWIPLSPAFGKRQRMSGNSRRGLPRRRRAGRNLPCRRKAMWMLKRHSALVRVIAAGSAAQRRLPGTTSKTKQERPTTGRRKEGER